jgi:hypothetical protein
MTTQISEETMYDELTVNVKVVKSPESEEDAPNFLTDIIKLLKLPSEELEVGLLSFENHFSRCASGGFLFCAHNACEKGYCHAPAVPYS